MTPSRPHDQPVGLPGRQDEHSFPTHSPRTAAAPEVTARRALAYARRGWPVFPCRPDGKEPATRHGFHDATTDPAQITRWWQRSPRANLAIATGAPGPDVLDVDQHGPAGHGFAAYHQLSAAGLLDHAHALIATPGGGLHAYFTGSGQPSGRLPRHHLDFKATGGYILAPPSQIGGRCYRLLDRQPESGHLDWAAVTSLLDPDRARLIRPSLTEPGDLRRLVTWVERLQPGNRNCGLYWAACRALEAGQPAILGDLAIAAAKAGLLGREINRTIASAQRGAGRLLEAHVAGSRDAAEER